MFRPGNLGHLGRLGLVAASQPSLIAQALAILAKYGNAANLYLPGVGAISGITAGNWLDSIGTTAASVDGQVGLVVSAGKELGPELVTSPNVAGLPAGGGTRFYNLSSKMSSSPVANKTYQIRYRVTGYTGTGNVGLAGSAPAGVVQQNHTADGVYESIQTVTASGVLALFTSNTNTCNFVLLTIRELPGAHLTQSTAANRPVLRLAGGVYGWDFVSSDSFTSTLTPGNAGFFCSGANVTDSGVLRTLLGAGAGSDASSGVWLARDASNALKLQVGNGTTRNSIGAPYPVATNAVASAGWDSSAMFVGINNTETSGAKSVNCTSANTINVGVLTGVTNPMLGTIGATIIMPTVLPTATERATLRQFIASLSGVTM